MFDAIRSTVTSGGRKTFAALLAAAALSGGFAAAASAEAATARSAADVPWSQVGSGWQVATWAPKANTDVTFFLVSPSGTRYSVGGAAYGANLLDWTSARGGQLLVNTSLGVREISMRTGARHTIPGLRYSTVSGYSRPGATAVFAMTYKDQHLIKESVTGKRLATYPSRIATSGAIHAPTGPVAVRTADEVVMGADHGLVVFGPKAGLVRRLIPTAASCDPASLLRTGVVVARCGKGALYSVPIAGGKATRLTNGPDKENPFGYGDYWAFSKGHLGTSPNGCGPDSLVRYEKDGTGTRIVVPQPVSGVGQESFVGHHGDIVEATFHRGGCGDFASTLFNWNAVTGRSTALLGPGVNGGSVTSVAPYAFDRRGGF